VKPDHTSTSRGGRQALEIFPLRAISNNIKLHTTGVSNGIDQPVDTLVAVKAAYEEKPQRLAGERRGRTLSLSRLESHTFLVLTQAAR
jgi:hypothetical protein